MYYCQKLEVMMDEKILQYIYIYRKKISNGYELLRNVIVMYVLHHII